jgi:PAS domain-containing protein
VEVLQRAAVETGMKLQWLPVNDAEHELLRGGIDVFPILTVTDERKRAFHFSEPWWASSQSLISLRERPLRNAAAAAGKRIAVRALSYGPATAERTLPRAIHQLTREPRNMISGVCSGEVDGALLEGRLIYDTLLEIQRPCVGHKLIAVPIPGTTLPMATPARPGAAAEADRLFAAIERLAMEGSVNDIGNRWFAMPQQRYSQALLAGHQRRNLTFLYGAAGLVVILLSLWYYRRALEMRRAADLAWARARQAEHRFETFMHHTPAGCIIKDAAGVYRYANQAFCEAVGRSAGGIMGAPPIASSGPPSWRFPCWRATAGFWKMVCPSSTSPACHTLVENGAIGSC